jgi:hypothetical protein
VLILLTWCFHDKGEVDEGNEHQIELVEATEDAPEPLAPSEYPFDLVAAAILRLLAPPLLTGVED